MNPPIVNVQPALRPEAHSERTLRPARPAFLVAGLCLYAMLSLVSMAAMSIGAGILAICLLASFGGRFREALGARISRAPAAIRTFAWISLAFALACVLSLVAARFWPLVIGGKTAHVEILRDSAKIWYFAWPFVLWFALSSCTLAERGKVLLTWFGAFGVLSLIGIAQHFTGWPRPQPIPPLGKYYHATLFLGHHLSVASVFIFPFFALLDLAFTRSPARRFCMIAVLAAGFVTLVFTYSRMLWVALPIGLVFWAFLRFRKGARAAILVLSLMASLMAYQVPAVRSRLTAQMGIHERVDLWEANWQFFLDRPITGVGFKRNQELSGYYLMQKYHTNDVFEGHAHDDFLEMLGSMGLMGLLVYLAWWLALVVLVVGSIRSRPEPALFFGKGLLAALLVFQLNGLTQVNFWEAKVQHQLMWVVAWALLWYSEGHVERARG